MIRPSKPRNILSNLNKYLLILQNVMFLYQCIYDEYKCVNTQSEAYSSREKHFLFSIHPAHIALMNRIYGHSPLTPPLG